MVGARAVTAREKGNEGEVLTGGKCRARAAGVTAVGEDRRGGGRGGGVRRRRGLAATVVSSLDPDPIGGEGERYFREGGKCRWGMRAGPSGEWGEAYGGAGWAGLAGLMASWAGWPNGWGFLFFIFFNYFLFCFNSF